MLKKLSNNNDNSGHSALNFIMTVVLIMVLGCGLLDLVNLVRLKSVVSQQANIYASAAVQQSGFKRNIPEDWKLVFGTNCKNYITKTMAVNNFKNAIVKINGLENTCKIVFNNKNLATATSDVIINWQDEATLTCSVDYKLTYLDAFGLIDTKFNCKSSHKVVGFWIHKTDKV